MSEQYIEYWGLTRHPFLLAPDSKMMCVTGQYFECLERLKYAIYTNKGGVLIVSEDAGLGKTTILLKLIDEMKEEYGDAFRFAFVDQPALTPAQMIAQITRSITKAEPHEDKLKNLTMLRDSLLESNEQGGKSIIIVDEAQMLCEAHDVLQELRTLINLTHNGQYLHTFILSGQRALWNTIKGMPEFWQRLPVRYYFIPLRVEETKEMIRFRLAKAGLDEGREIFDDDSLEIIHRFSRGSPRTVIALSDLALLVGFTNHSAKITFKEVSKAINTMSGKGETLPFMKTEKREGTPSFSALSNLDRGTEIGHIQEEARTGGMRGKEGWQMWLMQYGQYIRPLIALLVITALVLLIIIGFRYVFFQKKGSEVTEIARQESVIETKKDVQDSQKVMKETPVEKSASETTSEKKEIPLEEVVIPPEQPKRLEIPKPPRQPEAKKELPLMPSELQGPVRDAVINKLAANIRTRPDLNAPRFAMLFQGETVRIIDETTDEKGEKWYKIIVLGRRIGWVSETVVTLKQ
jgi:type II secretory pathway predicted ATPase ExeA